MRDKASRIHPLNGDLNATSQAVSGAIIGMATEARDDGMYIRQGWHRVLKFTPSPCGEGLPLLKEAIKGKL